MYYIVIRSEFVIIDFKRNNFEFSNFWHMYIRNINLVFKVMVALAMS